MKIHIWCKECGTEMELTTYRVNRITHYALVHKKPLKKECKYSEIALGLLIP
ncbi:MAG: hypothetical protein [Asgard archaea virus SkuldV2]|nr:MAG: hypothetical protein [Asgard archaea virus SkuldV2]